MKVGLDFWGLGKIGGVTGGGVEGGLAGGSWVCMGLEGENPS